MSAVLESAVVFDCAGDQLVGITHVPQSNVCAVGIVIVVGGPQYRVGSHRQFTLMARAFAAAGYPVLRFDYRGMGDSGGEVRAFDQVDDDIGAAVCELLRVAPVQRVVLWGLCDAASACMIYGARRDARICGLIVANPWVRTQAGEASVYLKHYYWQRLVQLSFWKKVLGGSFNVGRSFGDLLGKMRQAQSTSKVSSSPGGFIDRMLAGIQSVRQPALLLMSASDLTAKEFEDACNRNASWSEWRDTLQTTVAYLPGTDHTFSSPGAVSHAADICTRWLVQV